MENCGDLNGIKKTIDRARADDKEEQYLFITDNK
jgi:hypothetical protein